MHKKNKQQERDEFWINVGPESGYLGTIAEETARKNDGGISPDGKRLGWQNASTKTPSNTVPDGVPYCDCGDDCNCGDDTNNRADCACGASCNCNPNTNCGAKCNPATAYDNAVLPLPSIMPSNEFGVPIPIPDIGPEQQNTEENR